MKLNYQVSTFSSPCTFLARFRRVALCLFLGHFLACSSSSGNSNKLPNDFSLGKRQFKVSVYSNGVEVPEAKRSEELILRYAVPRDDIERALAMGLDAIPYEVTLATWADTQPSLAYIAQESAVDGTADPQRVSGVKIVGASKAEGGLQPSEADWGLEPGDIVTAIDLKEVTKLDDLLQALETLHDGNNVSLSFNRQGRARVLRSK